MIRHVVVVALAVIALCAASDALARKWASKSGQFTVEADLAEVQVVLKKADGSTVTVSVDKLSDPDRQFVLQSLDPGRGKSRNPFETPGDDPGTLVGKVISITDGDSISVLVGKTTTKVRLEGVDCPERGQPFGTAARKFTSNLCFGKEVVASVKGKDKYGRTLAGVTVGGKRVQAELVSAGLAWHYKQYSTDKELARLETEARKAKRGLWADENAVAPWEWRKLPASERAARASGAGEVRPEARAAISRGSRSPPAGTANETPVQLSHWLNTSSGVRHNSSCRWFGSTKKGRMCGADDGRACGQCGG